MVNRPLLKPETEMDLPQSIWIIFSNDTDIHGLRMLRRGYRHCFAIMQQDSRWILIDPRSNKTDIHLLPHPKTFNFPRYYTEQGNVVVKVSTLNVPQKILWPFPVSCVETLKRLVGLHSFWTVTPYQFYKKLLKLQTQKG